MIEIKRLNKQVNIPKYATADSAGVDLEASFDVVVEVPPLRSVMVPTGLYINMQTIPANMMAMIVPRSGKGAKEGKVLGNLTGIIDKDYHGELKICIWNRNPDKYITIEPSERIAQLIFVPIMRPEFKEVEEFSHTTERGAGGFGSTG